MRTGQSLDSQQGDDRWSYCQRCHGQKNVLDAANLMGFQVCEGSLILGLLTY